MSIQEATTQPPAVPRRGRLSGLLRSVRAAFQRLLGRGEFDPLEERDESFARLDVEALKEQLNLARDAARFGSRDLPRYDDATPDAPQIRVRQHLQDQFDEAFRRVNRELERLTDAIRARGVRDLVDRGRRLPDEVVQRARTESREATEQLESLRLQRAETQGRLSAFRERYALDRGPELKEPYQRKQLRTATILLALLQALANALLFAQGMTYGLSAGLLMAVGLGLFDIGCHFSLGRVAARVHSPDRLNRVLGGSFLLLIAGTVTLWNLGLVHLRIGIARFGFADGFEFWWLNFRQDTFGFTDFGSFALLGVGVACSVLAVVSAWHWDEPIPAYRKLGRALRDFDADLAFWRDRSERVVQEAVADGQDERDRLHENLDHNVHVAEAILQRMIRLKENLTVFGRDCERAHEVLVRFYRDENLLARSGPAPSYFQKSPVQEFDHPLAVDLAEIRDFVETQRRMRSELHDRTVALDDHVRAALEHHASTERRPSTGNRSSVESRASTESLPSMGNLPSTEDRASTERRASSEDRVGEGDDGVGGRDDRVGERM